MQAVQFNLPSTKSYMSGMYAFCSLRGALVDSDAVGGVVGNDDFLIASGEGAAADVGAEDDGGIEAEVTLFVSADVLPQVTLGLDGPHRPRVWIENALDDHRELSMVI